MKTKYLSIVLLLIFMCTFKGIAQEEREITAFNSAQNPCISKSQYAVLEKNCRENLKKISNKKTAQPQSTLLNWPLKPSASLLDCSYFFIAAHVDHDNAATTFRDYNCGTLSYDGHTGTDIAVGPFGFYKMDNNQVEVVAAAAGTIIDKHDGEYDRNCVGIGSGLTANYVIIHHADGSNALYWHMKKNAVTTKAIGAAVAQGEYLGIVGSSGSSSGPHLHFEVWTGNTGATKIDPFAGTCNLINANSWWNSQRPYKEQAILKASVHTTDVVASTCPNAETPNESTTYTIPFQGAGLAPGYAKFYVFMRNVSAGSSATLRILNPNGTVFNTWTYNFTAFYPSSYYGFSKVLPTISGTYTFEANYNGIICSQQFQIDNPLSVISNEFGAAIIYPNPSHNEITIQLQQPIVNGKLVLVNALGQQVKTIENLSGSTIKIDKGTLASGVYCLRLTVKGAVILEKKIIFTDY